MQRTIRHGLQSKVLERFAHPARSQGPLLSPRIKRFWRDVPRRSAPAGLKHLVDIIIDIYVCNAFRTAARQRCVCDGVFVFRVAATATSRHSDVYDVRSALALARHD